MFTDYALRVLVHTAARPDQRATSAQVADDFGISRHHVVKVVNQLQHLGYLRTVRGRTGGFTLARAPEEIRLGQVVRETEGNFKVVECFEPSTSTCPLTSACGLRSALGEALDAFFAVLDRYSLADLVARPQWIRRLITLTPVDARPAARAGAARR